MTKIESVLRATAIWAAAASASACVLAGASAAAAATAIDVPAQSFGHGQADSKPVVKWRPDASSWNRERSDGRSFGVNVPLGGGERLPLTVHMFTPEAQCHDADVTTAAEEQDDAFIRGGEGRDTRGR